MNHTVFLVSFPVSASSMGFLSSAFIYVTIQFCYRKADLFFSMKLFILLGQVVDIVICIAGGSLLNS